MRIKMNWIPVLLGLIVGVGLLGCVPAMTPAPAITPTAAPGQYDGQWNGSAVLEDGRSVNLSFSVQGSALSAVTYQFTGGAGLPCTNISYSQIPAQDRPRLSGVKLLAAPGIDLQLAAEFNSPGAGRHGRSVIRQQLCLC